MPNDTGTHLAISARPPRGLSLYLLLLAVLVLSTAQTVQAQTVQTDKAAWLRGTVTAGNTIYNVHLEDIPELGIGLYTATTGADHPAGPGLNILFGGGQPGTSYSTIRSYTSETDYVPYPGDPAAFLFSSFSILSLDPFGAVEPLGATGFRTIYTLPGPPVTPDALTVIQDVLVLGTTFSDSRIEISTTIINDGPDPVEIGVRYLWDYQIGDDDGPTFQALTPNGPVLVTESVFSNPDFQVYRMEDNDVNPLPPTFNVLGTTTGPASLGPTTPDLLQFVGWFSAVVETFDYTVDPTANVAEGGDSAVLYFFGSDQEHAIEIPAGGRYTVTASAFGTPPPPPDDETPPACDVTVEAGPPASATFSVQDEESGLAAVNVVTATNATVTVSPFVVGATDPIVVTAVKDDPTLDAEVVLQLTDVAGNVSEACRWEDRGDDTTEPECEITGMIAGPPKGVEVRVQDLQSGLAAVNVLVADNADVTIPAFAPGSTDPLTITATRADNDQRATVVLEVIDRSGNRTECDPVMTTLVAELPASFGLEQNYPNPFNPETMIRFSLPEAGHVHLAVYDATGRRVATLVDGSMEAGTYEATWDGRRDDGVHAAGGMYFYTLEAGVFRTTRAMVLLK